jgi:hypothetical protein
VVSVSLVWAQFRGFDLFDGGYYFLLYHDLADDPDTHTRFGFIASPFWWLCGENVVRFRVLTLIFASAAGLGFAQSWRSLLTGSVSCALEILGLWLAVLAALTWVPVALTYNSLAAILTLIGLAILMRTFRITGARGEAARIGILGGGALLALLVVLFLVKPPAAVALSSAIYFLLCFHPGYGSRLKAVLSAAGLAGLALLGATLLYITLGSHPLSDRALDLGGVILSAAWIKGTLLRYADEISRLLPSLRIDFRWTIAPVLGGMVAAVLLERGAHIRRWGMASLLLLLVGLTGAIFQRRLWDGSFAAAVSGEAARFYLLLWGSLLAIWAFGHWRPPQGDRAAGGATAWVVVFFLVPLISSFGSTNTLYVGALHETVLWAAGALILAGQIGEQFRAPWFRTGVAGLICLCAGGQLFSGQFWKPYMFQPSLWKQTTAVEVGFPATKLLVDPALASFLHEIRATLDSSGYKAGDDVFGFFNLPGVIFAIGAKEPGAPWYFGTWYHQDDTDGQKLRRVPLERRRNAWILTQADVRPFRRQFLESGIDFPDGYLKIGQTINPTSGLEIGIWKPLSRP